MDTFYADKRILLTGATGFLGKTILYKILTSLPSVATIYVLIRAKERLKREIFDSSIFQLARAHQGFESFFFSRVQPIAGDLLVEDMGISPTDTQTLIENVDLVINCAASVDFNTRLDDAARINIFGTLRAHDLFSRMVRGKTFLHVSTAYVNADIPGFLEERIYPKGFDPEALFAELQAMKEPSVETQKKLIGGFPNTYTFTKYLTERLLFGRAGPQQNVVIIRPSIIGCAWRDPVQGWVDSVAAAGALFLLGGLGIINFVRGSNAIISDLVPVDLVADFILTAACYSALQPPGSQRIFQCCSSDLNPVTFGLCSIVVQEYWKSHPSQTQFGPTNFKFLQNPVLLKLCLLRETVPLAAYSGLATFLKSQKMIKKARSWQKVMKRGHSVAQSFAHFCSNEFTFRTSGFQLFSQFLSPHDQKRFPIDIKAVDWHTYLTHFAWGLHHFVLKEDVPPPLSNSVSRSPSKLMPDFHWALSHGRSNLSVYKSSLVKRILSSVELQSLITTEHTKAWARARCDEMLGEHLTFMNRFCAWLVHKFFKKIFDKIVIDQQQLQALRDLDRSAALILAPNHTSYIDILICAYIFYAHDLKNVFFNTNQEIGRIYLLGLLLRVCGASFIQMQKYSDPQLRLIEEEIVTQYCRCVLETNSNMELFAEGSRSRSGKLQKSKNTILDLIAKAQVQGKLTATKVIVVPIHIVYERVVESEQFALALLGEASDRPTLRSLLKSMPFLKENFGRIFVEFLPHINLKQFAETELQVRPNNAQKLGCEILRTIRVHSRLVSPTAVVASVVLMSRKAGVSKEMVLDDSNKVASFLGRLGRSLGSNFHADKSLDLLANLVATKRDMFNVTVSPGSDHKTLLLAYYKNQLLNFLFHESVILIAVSTFGSQVEALQGIDLERLLQEIRFLLRLFQQENPEPSDPTFTDAAFDRLSRLGVIINTKNSQIKIADEFTAKYLCSLLWPFIDSYFVTVGHLFKLKQNEYRFNRKELIDQTQWFAESLYIERVVDHYECCSRETIKNALKQFKEMKFLSKDPKTKKYALLCTSSQLQEIEQQLNKYLQNSYAKSLENFAHKPRLQNDINAKL